jgi:hypothetical protein
MSVPRITKVGPSFETTGEHFHVFGLNDGQWAFVIGNVDWSVGDPIPIEPPEGTTVDICPDLKSVEEEWDRCADTIDNSMQDGQGERMDEAWNAWPHGQASGR